MMTENVKNHRPQEPEPSALQGNSRRRITELIVLDCMNTGKCAEQKSRRCIEARA